MRLFYGWTYKWIQKLISLGIFKENKNKIILQERNEFYRSTISYIKKIYGNNVSFYYSVLQLFGIVYSFTKIDSVFI